MNDYSQIQSKSQFLKTLCVSVVFILALALVGSAKAGTVVASSGFKVNPNGFNFPNYTNQEGYMNLNANELQRIYGSGVCLTGKGASCVLTPAASAWMKQANAAMAGGHCFGMASLSSIIKWNKLKRFGYNDIYSAFGSGPFAYNLDMEGNTRLQGAIARAFIAQDFPSVQNAEIDNVGPNRILSFLRKNMSSFKKNPYTLSIFQPGFKDGHEITPIAVEDRGSGVYDVHVYDNNWPNDNTRRLTIDTKTNSWSYYAVNTPGYPEYIYKGNAKTKTLELTPVNPQLQVQPCPFCLGRQGKNAKYNQVTLSSTGAEHARLLIIDKRGRKLGIVGNHKVNQIPGAKIFERSSGITINAKGQVKSADSLEPVYMVPKRLAFKIRISGKNLSYQDSESLSVIGPAFDATINELSIGKKQTAYLSFSPKTKRISFTSTRAVKSSPYISLGAQSKNDAYQINIGTAGSAKGRTLVFTKNTRNNIIKIASKHNTARNYTVQIIRENKTGENEYVVQYKVNPRQQAYLNYAPLDKRNGVAKIIIKNRKTGKFVKRIPLQKVS